jgi:hypothetical protein
MLLLYIATALLPIFILVVKSKKTKETQRQKAAWEEHLATFNPVILRSVAVNKEVVSGKKYYPSDIIQCELFLLSASVLMLAKKEPWRYPNITATALAKQKDDMLPGVDDCVIIQSVSATESTKEDKVIQIKGKDANYALRTFTISFHHLSDEHFRTLQAITTWQ